MNGKTSSRENAPGEYFDETSFKTLYGGVFVTWVTTNTIVDLWGVPDPKMLGFIIALAVAFIGYLMSEKRTLKRLLVTPFNGFLIYLTIMGGTSFLPAPEPYVPGTEFIESTESGERSERPASERTSQERTTLERSASERPVAAESRSSFTRSWSNPDQQLVEVTRQLQVEKQEIAQTARQLETEKREIQQTAQQLETEKQELEVVNTELRNLSRTYELRLDSTRRTIENMQLSQPEREAIMPMLRIERPERTIGREIQ